MLLHIYTHVRLMTQYQTHQFPRDYGRTATTCLHVCTFRGVASGADVKPRVVRTYRVSPLAFGEAHVLDMSENGGCKFMAVEEETVGGSEDVSVGKDRTDSSLEDSLSSQLSSSSLEKSKLSLHELSFLGFPNQSQSNVYGLVNIRCDGENRLLVATLQGEVFWLEHSHDGLRTSLKPINFSYIPGTFLYTRLIDDSVSGSG